MPNKPLRDYFNKSSLNVVFLVGEVIKSELIQHEKRHYIKSRIKMRPATRGCKNVYVDIYGRQNYTQVMSLVCRVGNIVYIEGEFRNLLKDGSTYVIVNKATLLLKSKEHPEPNSKLIALLDSLDPIGYVSTVKPKRSKNAKSKEED